MNVLVWVFRKADLDVQDKQMYKRLLGGNTYERLTWEGAGGGRQTFRLRCGSDTYAGEREGRRTGKEP